MDITIHGKVTINGNIHQELLGNMHQGLLDCYRHPELTRNSRAVVSTSRVFLS